MFAVMNCKPGDLAILIHSSTGREGAILEVIEYRVFDAHPAWLVSYRGSTLHPDSDWQNSVALDSWLRPLRGNEKEKTLAKELEAA